MSEHPSQDGPEPSPPHSASTDQPAEATTESVDLSLHARPRPVDQRAIDVWAHRRAEPRLFAFLWSMYVLIAVMGSILWLARMPVGPSGASSMYSPAARTLLVVIAAGITVLWPMTRLSQEAPERDPVGASLADLLVVQLPVQMVIWPMAVLANWPTPVVLAVAMLFLAWGLLTGGVLAVAFSLPGRLANGRAREPRPSMRWVWMVVCIALVVAAPAAAMLAARPDPHRAAWLDMSSPFTAIFSVSGSGWTGPTTAVQRPQWTAVWLTACAGVVLWVGAALLAPAGRGGKNRLH